MPDTNTDILIEGRNWFYQLVNKRTIVRQDEDGLEIPIGEVIDDQWIYLNDSLHFEVLIDREEVGLVNYRSVLSTDDKTPNSIDLPQDVDASLHILSTEEVLEQGQYFYNVMNVRRCFFQLYRKTLRSLNSIECDGFEIQILGRQENREYLLVRWDGGIPNDLSNRVLSCLRRSGRTGTMSVTIQAFPPQDIISNTALFEVTFL